MTSAPNALIITRQDIRRIMRPSDFLDAVEIGFQAGAIGKAFSPHPMNLPASNGGFHAKGASISLGRDYAAVKVNGNFPGNPARHGLPTIQGAIVLSDGNNGTLLAILDSIEVTLRRTAAASALAAGLLARPASKTLLICGCGEQGRAHFDALRHVLPIERCLLWDRDATRAEDLASELNAEAVGDLKTATGRADVIACCTTATEPYLEAGMVRPGAFVAAVGADNPEKCEVAPSLMAVATVITDVTAQCAEMGDLHHAINAGCRVADSCVELGEVLVGEKAGRTTDPEIIIFDSTGTALLDVAAAAAIYERCKDDNSVRSVALSAP